MIVRHLLAAGLLAVTVAQVSVNPFADNPFSGKIQTIINWLGAFGIYGSLGAILIGAGTMGASRAMAHQGGSIAGTRVVFAGATGALLVGSAALIVNSLQAL